MLFRSVDDPQWTIANLAALGDDPVFNHVFGYTLRTALLVTVVTLLLGFPVAQAMTRLRRAGAALVLMVVLLPFWTSVLVRSYTWMVLLGRHGVINEALTSLGLIDAPLKLLNTPLAVTVAMSHILLPYMILPIANALRQIDAALPLAAYGLGARPLAVFRRVILPLAAPGVAAGAMLVFVLGFGFYITPMLVGGPRDVMLSMLIAQQVDLLHWPYAACLSAVLLAATLLMVGLFRLALGVRQPLGVPGLPSQGARPRLPADGPARLARLLGNALVGAVLLFLAVPILMIVWLSFSSASYLRFPPPGLSLRWYAAYLGSADWLGSTGLSLGVAGAVVVLAGVLGTAASLGLARLPPVARALAAGMIISPLIVPVIVVSIGVYYAYSRFGLVGSPLALVLAHTCLAVPFVVTSVGASLAGVDRRLEQAAWGLGATRWATFRRVTLPLIRPGILVGALFAFITSFDELVVALFLSGDGAITLPRRMWDDLRFAIDPTIAAVSTLTTVLTALLLLGVQWQRRAGRAGGA